MILFISERVLKLKKTDSESTPLQRLADRCQQTEEGSSRRDIVQEMERSTLRFRTSRTNGYSTCKQYDITDLGIITKAHKTSLFIFTLRLILDSKSYNCFYIEVEVTHCLWWLAYGLDKSGSLSWIGQQNFLLSITSILALWSCLVFRVYRWLFQRAKMCWKLKVRTNLHLRPSLRMSGAVPLLPNMNRLDRPWVFQEVESPRFQEIRTWMW